MKLETHERFSIAHTAAADDDRDVIVGNSTAAHSLRQMAALAAGSSGPLLITGPNGSGKECVARAIHAASPRRSGPFVKIRCGLQEMPRANTTNFSDDPYSIAGLETAHGGTLFLDDAEEMSIDVQTLVAHLIGEQAAPSLLAPMPAPLDVRVVASTSQCLATMVTDGNFKQDLYYSLSSLTLPVPPLRQRREDLDVLIDYFLEKKHPAQHFSLNWAAMQVLRMHHWPGNVRELRNLVARACLFHCGQTIGAKRVNALLAMGQPLRAGPETVRNWNTPIHRADAFKPGFNLKTYLEEEEKRFLQTALDRANGVVQHAADLSGIKRTTFIEKMRRLGIERRKNKRI
jgi:sigma-54 dependent transcriptional regulator, flagellar regulatory protein